MINTLHSESWFRYGDARGVAHTRMGGRQGCKLGAVIFNVLYAEAMVRLQVLADANELPFSIQRRSEPFKCESPHVGSDNIVYFTYL